MIEVSKQEVFDMLKYMYNAKDIEDEKFMAFIEKEKGLKFDSLCEIIGGLVKLIQFGIGNDGKTFRRGFAKVLEDAKVRFWVFETIGIDIEKLTQNAPVIDPNNDKGE